MEGRKLVFRRAANMRSGRGMAEAPREFARAEDKTGPHPLIGAMKGTFTIEPGYDLTSPLYTDKEWAEIERQMDEDWTQIEQGMARHEK